MMRYLILINLLLLIRMSHSQTKMESGKEVINAMFNTYANGKWFKHFTFSQETHFYKEGKKDKTEIWHEAISSPGKLLIKFKSKDSKNGVLFVNNTVHVYSENTEPQQKPMIHDLALLAFDVYFLQPEKTIHLIDSLGYNLNIVREDLFNDRKVYVIGAFKNDSVSNQIWVDAERFYLHRLIYKQGKSNRDVILSNYKKMRGNWVAKKIIFKQNGILQMEEDYFDIKFPKTLNDQLFDSEKFNEVKLN